MNDATQDRLDDGVTSITPSADTLGRTSCKRGHPLTSENIRVRRGRRAGHRECLTCYRIGIAGRDRSGAPNDPVANMVRSIRRIADRRFLVASKSGDIITLTRCGRTEFTGTVVATHQWLTGPIRTGVTA